MDVRAIASSDANKKWAKGAWMRALHHHFAPTPQRPLPFTDAYRARVWHKTKIGPDIANNLLILLALPRGLEPLFSP
jgi:hypothetical protein